MDGFINIYKEQGYTSFDVVAKLRGILKQKKIGHTGTLDPMAEGVLIVCLGKATKLADLLTSGTKEYRAIMKLGIETDTEDITGNVLTETDSSTINELSDNVIIDSIKSFIGDYMQIPPMYSAIKKDGKKLYEYARKGIEIEREPRPVSIFSISNIKIDLPYVSFDVHCSKGTYIRSLCRDIGKELSVGACLSGLTRSEVHGYTLDTALKLSEVEKLRDDGKLEEYVLPIDSLLSNYPVVTVRQSSEKLILNGNKLILSDFVEDSTVSEKELQKADYIRVNYNKDLIALYKYNQDLNEFKPYKMFL